MHRQPLLALLDAYTPSAADDARARARIRRFVADHPRCLERSLSGGHVTGSALVVDRERTRVLLTHHRKLGRWLQLGGHADGDPDLLAVALREAREESGIEGIEAVSRAIFDLDIHPIPAHGPTAAHLHYDVRFLAQADGRSEPRASRESKAVAWVPIAEVSSLTTDRSVLRMIGKLAAWPPV